MEIFKRILLCIVCFSLAVCSSPAASRHVYNGPTVILRGYHEGNIFGYPAIGPAAPTPATPPAHMPAGSAE